MTDDRSSLRSERIAAIRARLESWLSHSQQRSVTHRLIEDALDELDRLARDRDEMAGLPTEDLLDSLHAVFARHGIASRSDLPPLLIGDLVAWAARKCREATRGLAASSGAKE